MVGMISVKAQTFFTDVQLKKKKKNTKCAADAKYICLFIWFRKQFQLS